MPGMPTPPGGVEEHFVVLPDCDDALAAAKRFSRPRTRTVRHPSGRPWLIGRWSDANIVFARTSRASLIVLGSCPVTVSELAHKAGGLRDLTELDALAQSLPGSFHLIGSLDQRIRIHGSATGLRRVFHATVQGTVVATSRADTLASAIRAIPDQHRIATRLLWPVPKPFDEGSMWQGVEAVAPEDALVIEPDGQNSRVSNWWSPPEPTRSVESGAPAVREALADAVGARADRGGTISCDLSGDSDSTTICFVAARSSAKVVASTSPGHGPADSDLQWARYAAEHLPEVEHVVWSPAESPHVYGELLEIGSSLDEPTIGVPDRARALAHVPTLRAKGSRLHLTAIGGDHVAWGSAAYYHRLVRTRPLLALRRLRGFRALWNWPVIGMYHALADSRSYPEWLSDSARDLRGPLPASERSALGWGIPPRLSGWITPEAAHLARESLSVAADHAAPLSPDRGMHADLARIRSCTRVLRQWDQLSARAGLPLASPFVDDRVVEAFLSVHPGQRVTPWQYKPLLARAMDGIVPDSCLRRRNRSIAAMDAPDGLREHRDDLAALWKNSRLAERGLVDAHALRTLVLRPEGPGFRDAILHSTIACEVWLRNLERTARATVPQQGAGVPC
ncbi:lasso peptide isopeptide bond-forming cyclase [Parasphingorhabdus pacifica]